MGTLRKITFAFFTFLRYSSIGVIIYLSSMMLSNTSNRSPSREEDSDVLELPKEDEMTSTSGSSLEYRNLNSKELNEKVIKLLDNLADHNCDDISKELVAHLVSVDRIKAVSNILFEKAVSAENNASIYAKLFKQMNTKKIVPFFRKNFLKLCQSEFEKDKSEECGVESTLMEIVLETSEEKKIALRAQLVNKVQKMRERSLGVCRFLGELYVVGALNSAIITVCLDHLLKNEMEHDLECLCVLMKITGKVLQEKAASVEKYDIEKYFCKMDEFINKGETSVDISIKWKEVLLLKNNGWIPVVGANSGSGAVNVEQAETGMKVPNNLRTIDDHSLPKNDLKTIPFIKGKEDKISADTAGGVKILSSSINNHFSSIAPIVYEEGQWSPSNPLGKKKYGSEFLHRLRYSPLSLKNPNLTAQAECILPYKLERIMETKLKKENALPVNPFLKKNADLERDLSQNAVILDPERQVFETTDRQNVEMMEQVEEIPEIENEDSIKLKKATEEIVTCLKSASVEEVALKIMKLNISNEFHLKAVVRVIYEQGYLEPRIFETYAKLCLYLNNANFGWQAMKEGDPNDNFKKTLLEYFQKEFQRSYRKGKINLSDFQEKNKLRGVTSFFGHLYKVGMIADPLLVMGIKALLRCGDDYCIELLVNIMSLRKPFCME